MRQTELLQIATGQTPPKAEPTHLIRKPVPAEVSTYLRTRKGVSWPQLQSEVAEAFGLVITAGTLLRHRDGGR